MIVLAGNLAPSAGGVERTLGALAAELRAGEREVGQLVVGEAPTLEGVTPLRARVAWARGAGVLGNPRRLHTALRAALEAEAPAIEQLWARNPEAAWAGAGLGFPVLYVPPGLVAEVLVWDRVWRGRSLKGRLKDAVWRLWFEPLARRTEARAVRDSAAVVVFSRNMRDLLAETYPDAADRIHVVAPGVDARRFSPGPPSPGAARAVRGWEGRPVVVHVGRLERRKGAHLLVDAVARLEGLHLLLVGDGVERPALEARVAALGLGERVRFTGHVPDPEGYLRAGSVSATPSLFEPFGHVLLEALASGLPVVAFARSAGARVASDDVIRPGQTGVLVGETTPEALAAGLEEGLALARRTGTPQRCREDVLTRFRWPAFVARVLELGAGCGT